MIFSVKISHLSFNLGKAEIPELPFHDDFYYPFEYNSANIEKAFWSELSSRFKSPDKRRIERAYNQAVKLHFGQTRLEAPDLPYVIHPIEVALAVMKQGGSPDSVIAALLHDVREDVEWVKGLENGEVAEKFESRVVEVLTRLLSKFRFENGKVIKLSKEEYFRRLSGDWTAVWIKGVDRRMNLKSLGRMLDLISPDQIGKSQEIINFVKNGIQTTREFVIPVVREKYPELAENLEKLTIKLETRLQVAETFLLQNEASNLQDALLPSDAVCDPSC